MVSGIGWLKHLLLEVQEYVGLCGATFRGCVTRPFYRYDFREQLVAIDSSDS